MAKSLSVSPALPKADGGKDVRVAVAAKTAEKVVSAEEGGKGMCL
jgi:hypothetical protein